MQYRWIRILLRHRLVPRGAELIQAVVGEGVIEAVFIHLQAGGDDIRPGHGAVHKLLAGAHGGADDLRLPEEAVVGVDIHDILNVVHAVLAAGSWRR